MDKQGVWWLCLSSNTSLTCRAPKVDSTMGTTLGSTRQNSTSLSSEEEENLPPIPGVKLGPLLGKGSFGSVHYGTWNGAQIAVKVRLPRQEPCH